MKIVKKVFIFAALTFSGVVFSDYPPPRIPAGTFDVIDAVEKMSTYIWNGEIDQFKKLADEYFPKLSYSQLMIFVLAVAQRGLVLSSLNTLYSVDGLPDVFKETYYQALKEAEKAITFEMNTQKANGVPLPFRCDFNYYLRQYIDVELQKYGALSEEDAITQPRYISLLLLRVLDKSELINGVLQLANFIERGLGKDIELIRIYLSQETNNLNQMQDIIENELEKFVPISEEEVDQQTFVRKNLDASENDEGAIEK